MGKSVDVGTSLLQVPTTWSFWMLQWVLPSGARRIRAFPPLRRPGRALPLHPTAFYKRLAKISGHCGAGLTNYSACEKLR